MKKNNWRKFEKEIYSLSKVPRVIKINKQNYLCINGKGNSNSDEFAAKIQALYQFSYKAKILLLKKELIANRYTDYVVYPLEGKWDLSEKEITLENIDKEKLIYTIMIRQPDFFNQDLFNQLKEKMDFDYLNNFYFEIKDEHLVVQMLHIGSFDEEKKTLDEIKAFIKDSEYKIKNLTHQEIYLSDFRKTKTENLKTILRYEIELK